MGPFGQEEPPMLTELRRYRIEPDRLDSWLAFFREVLVEHSKLDIRVEYAGVVRETSTFIWLRSFDDEADRVARKDAFYGSDWWNQREAFAMSHVLEYDVTFLDAAVVRDGGQPIDVPFVDGEWPGSRGDRPPDGWVASTRRTFARSREPNRG
jgi:hypothetical protein